MKFSLLAVFIFSSITFSADAIDQYYQGTHQLTGFKLKTALNKILSTSHKDQGYSALFHVYLKSDADNSYDGDGSVVDMYSEIPATKDPYNFSQRKHMCGQYKGESDCFNREHLFPQSIFSRRPPMKADFFHVYPSDGYVNNKRGSHPFGEVSRAKWVSRNGSKVGPHNKLHEYSGSVFEPIDEFKGDIARALLYFATRYERKVSKWSHDMLNGTSDQVYADWFIKLLLKWSKNDPVSKHEIQRNNAGYEFQGNRNPFIDHPEWVNAIWAKN